MGMKSPGVVSASFLTAQLYPRRALGTILRDSRRPTAPQSALEWISGAMVLRRFPAIPVIVRLGFLVRRRLASSAA